MNELKRAPKPSDPPGIYILDSRVSARRLRQKASKFGWRFYVLDGTKISDKKSYLAEIAKVMQFPDYFGKNWDALNDVLTDMSWAQPGNGYEVLFENPQHFIETSPEDWRVARELFETGIEFWRQAGIPYYVLLRGPRLDELEHLE